MATMQAAILRGLGDIVCDEVPRSEAGADKVLVKMQMASICGTDLHYVYYGWPRNEYPMAPGEPGHEGVGVVEDPGPTSLREGARVLTVPNIWEARNFAAYQAVSPHFIVELPDDRPVAELMMAQQLGTVIFAGRKLPPMTGKTVVVIGQGSAGLFHDFYLRRLGASRIIAIEPNADRRAAGVALGVDDAIDVTGEAAVDAVAQLTDGRGAEVVVDAVGGHETLDQAVRMAQAEGHVHVFGLPTGFGTRPFDLGRVLPQTAGHTHDVRGPGRGRTGLFQAGAAAHSGRRDRHGPLCHAHVAARAGAGCVRVGTRAPGRRAESFLDDVTICAEDGAPVTAGLYAFAPMASRMLRERRLRICRHSHRTLPPPASAYV